MTAPTIPAKEFPPVPNPSTPPGTTFESEQRQALLARILASPHFARSMRLRDFLLYVVEHAVKDPGARIHEHEIAERVFGRCGMQGEDTIVRVNASQLRRRLEQYFHLEGAGEEIVIEIPKGSYTPAFRVRPVTPVGLEAKEESGQTVELVPAVVPARTRGALQFAAAGAFLLIAGLLAWDDLRLRTELPAPPTPYVGLFWSVFLNARLNVDVVMADSNLSIFQHFTRVDMSVEQYANRDYQAVINTLSEESGLRNSAAMLTRRRYTSASDAYLARRISMLANPRNDRFQILHARDFQPGRLKTDNVVLIGSRRSDPWAELFENQLNFQYTYEGPRADTIIRNVKPLPGEQAVYRVEEVSGRRIPGGYCVVARLPNLSGKGTALLIAGTETEATEAGGEFVINETSLAQLHSALGLHSGAPFPDFEALFATTRVGGASPAARLISVRRH